MDHETIASHYARDIESVAEMASSRENVELLPLNYADVLDQPLAQAQKIAAFLNRGIPAEVMASVVDPQLYRSKAGQ